MTSLVLLHGGAHGAWSWTRLRPALEHLGFCVVAPDLPLDDPDVGLADCARLVKQAVGDVNEPVVVAHSASGAFLPLAADAINARLMVFLCAVVPAEGKSWVQQLAEDPSPFEHAPAAGVTTDSQGRAIFSPSVARQAFFNDCAEDLASWAERQLSPFAQRIPTDVFPVGGWPQIPAAYILGAKDQAISPRWSRRVARERLGVEPIEVPTGHDPFLSEPRLLAESLARLVHDGQS